MKRGQRIIGILFTIGFLVLLWFVRSVVVYLVVSIVLTLIISPLLRLLDKVEWKNRTLPNWSKALLGILTLYTVLYLLLSLFSPLLYREFQMLSSIDLEQLYRSLAIPINELETLAESYGVEVEQGDIETVVREEFLGVLDIAQIPDFFSSLVSGLGNIVVAIFSISFITFFLLKDRWIIDQAVDALTPDRFLDQVHRVIENANKTLSRYFLGLLAQISLITALVSISLTVIGVENSFIIGFFAGVINVIPYIGPLIGGAFGLVIAITTNLDMDLATELLPFSLKVASVFLVVQLLDNVVFQPLIFSNSISAHPLEIFLVIMVAGQLAGITGMVLAVPSYSFIRIIAREFFSEFKVVKTITRQMKES